MTTVTIGFVDWTNWTSHSLNQRHINFKTRHREARVGGLAIARIYQVLKELGGVYTLSLGFSKDPPEKFATFGGSAVIAGGKRD